MFGICVHFILIGITYIFENNIEQTVIKLDENNEFIGLFSNGFMYISLFLSFLFAMGTLLIYRNTNRPKGTYIYHFFFGIYVMICLVLSFKLGQLFVTTFALRILYNILFICTFLYAFYLSYSNAKEITLGTPKHRHFLIEWGSRHSKKIYSTLFTVAGIYYTYKVFALEDANLEQRLLGNLAFLFPFIVALANFVYLYCCDVFLRSYYVSKYSESFRKKYHYSPEQWYGPNYKRDRS